MATQTVRSDAKGQSIPWGLIGRIGLLIFFILFLALPLWHIIQEIFNNPQLLMRQLVIGLTNGAYIALIALGYTLVYGIVELINFAHGDLYMLGAFFALTLIGLFALTPDTAVGVRIPLMILVLLLTMVFTSSINSAFFTQGIAL
jgi:branched-chain amino acid transport system permease protein